MAERSLTPHILDPHVSTTLQTHVGSPLSFTTAQQIPKSPCTSQCPPQHQHPEQLLPAPQQQSQQQLVSQQQHHEQHQQVSQHDGVYFPTDSVNIHHHHTGGWFDDDGTDATDCDLSNQQQYHHTSIVHPTSVGGGVHLHIALNPGLSIQPHLPHNPQSQPGTPVLQTTLTTRDNKNSNTQPFGTNNQHQHQLFALGTSHNTPSFHPAPFNPNITSSRSQNRSNLGQLPPRLSLGPAAPSSSAEYPHSPNHQRMYKNNQTHGGFINLSQYSDLSPHASALSASPVNHPQTMSPAAPQSTASPFHNDFSLNFQLPHINFHPFSNAHCAASPAHTGTIHSSMQFSPHLITSHETLSYSNNTTENLVSSSHTTTRTDPSYTPLSSSLYVPTSLNGRQSQQQTSSLTISEEQRLGLLSDEPRKASHSRARGDTYQDRQDKIRHHARCAQRLTVMKNNAWSAPPTSLEVPFFNPQIIGVQFPFQQVDMAKKARENQKNDNIDKISALPALSPNKNTPHLPHFSLDTSSGTTRGHQRRSSAMEDSIQSIQSPLKNNSSVEGSLLSTAANNSSIFCNNTSNMNLALNSPISNIISSQPAKPRLPTLTAFTLDDPTNQMINMMGSMSIDDTQIHRTPQQHQQPPTPNNTMLLSRPSCRFTPILRHNNVSQCQSTTTSSSFDTDQCGNTTSSSSGHYSSEVASFHQSISRTHHIAGGGTSRKFLLQYHRPQQNKCPSIEIECEMPTNFITVNNKTYLGPLEYSDDEQQEKDIVDDYIAADLHSHMNYLSSTSVSITATSHTHNPHFSSSLTNSHCHHNIDNVLFNDRASPLDEYCSPFNDHQSCCGSAGFTNTATLSQSTSIVGNQHHVSIRQAKKQRSSENSQNTAPHCNAGIISSFNARTRSTARTSPTHHTRQSSFFFSSDCSAHRHSLNDIISTTTPFLSPSQPPNNIDDEAMSDIVHIHPQSAMMSTFVLHQQQQHTDYSLSYPNNDPAMMVYLPDNINNLSLIKSNNLLVYQQ